MEATNSAASDQPLSIAPNIVTLLFVWKIHPERKQPPWYCFSINANSGLTIWSSRFVAAVVSLLGIVSVQTKRWIRFFA